MSKQTDRQNYSPVSLKTAAIVYCLHLYLLVYLKWRIYVLTKSWSKEKTTLSIMLPS